ncbi:hypothetical protein [Streptomyces sp. EN27]|uniref:hypothetical protein n=1 Tax=Streptomyces sp. EN27 TaxID=211464 RepID=UPI000851F1C3|nr:hypothetical protein [Streptomyces sp. EN27]
MHVWIRFWTAVWIGSEQLTRHTVRWLCNAKPKPPSAPKKPVKEQPAQDTAGGEPEEAPGEQAEKAPAKGPADTEGSALLRWFGIGLVLAVTKFTPYTTVAAVVAAAAWVVTSLALGYLATMKPQPQPEPEPESTDEDADQEQLEETPEPEQHPSDLLPLSYVAVLLNDAYTEGSGVHLATLAARLTVTPLMGLPATPWKTGHVRALLTRHGVRVRPGVRVPPLGGREGVHKRDFPPLPPAPSGPPVVAGVVAGQPNNNNASNISSPPFRITPDPHNPVRHHVHHERT